MINKKFLAAIEKQHAAYERAYRKLVEDANRSLHLAKRAIFAFHRGDRNVGESLLGEAEKLLGAVGNQFKQEPALEFEGAYRAALEEFVEARLFGQFLSKKSLGAVPSFQAIDPEVYLGGLADLTGELVRYGVGRATVYDIKEVHRAKETLDQVMTFLVGLDLTGYLRTKYDQAKNSARRMEEIVYQMSVSACLNRDYDPFD
ncbi:hypothetical protein HY628_02740 [Candidatus Uhrbacteria bacterium]|nr:hypothetical protein [Candidatus Uhrbacteria bacterium]